METGGFIAVRGGEGRDSKGTGERWKGGNREKGDPEMIAVSQMSRKKQREKRVDRRKMRENDVINMWVCSSFQKPK